MRIISGKYKGKKLSGFSIDGTRPTMDRVKESIFASIQQYIPNSIVLDLFSGSGSLGLEAISNGAKEAYLIDNNNVAIETLKHNSQGIDNIHIIQSDYEKYLINTNVKFDLIFLDPPYNLNLINNALKLIKDNQILKENGLIICEYEKEIINEFYDIWKQKKYGKTSVIIFKG